VAEKDGAVIGWLAGGIAEQWFSRQLMAFEYGLFIAPEHRGGTAGPRLAKAFITWAEEHGAAIINMGITTGVHEERTGDLYSRLGLSVPVCFIQRGVTMCTGLEMAAIGASVLAAGGAVYSGQQQKKMSNYQAAQAEADAEAAQAARVEADRIRKAGRAQAAQANASLAASGVDTGEGTALRIQSGIVGDAEQDAYQTILNGTNQSARLNAQASADRISGRNASTSGYISAGSSLLSAGGTYNGWKKAGSK
jgi:hypothetical protein